MTGFPKATASLAFAFLLATLLGGCSDRNVQEPSLAAPPPAEESLELVPAWAKRTNNVATLKANFAKTGAARTIWDIPFPCDLRVRSGIQFDFWCNDLRPFTGFSCYFKSGKGWYHGSFSPEEAGKWQRVVVRKTETRVEDTPDGWGAITLTGRLGRDHAHAHLRMARRGGQRHMPDRQRGVPRRRKSGRRDRLRRSAGCEGRGGRQGVLDVRRQPLRNARVDRHRQLDDRRLRPHDQPAGRALGRDAAVQHLVPCRDVPCAQAVRKFRQAHFRMLLDAETCWA